jgi:pyruvate/2-oxoglutarate dehydrogenase complex dihydrolipoamide dehydrogenase (E3) component
VTGRLPQLLPMSERIEADICVIGAGSAGLSVAAGAAQLGRRTVLIEADRMGGDCLNTGCVPSKSLIAAAHMAHARRASAPFGVRPAEPDVDFAAVHRQVHEVIAQIAPHDSVERFEGLGVTVIKDRARFRMPDEVEIGDGRRVRARRFVVATGSRAAVPPVPGLDAVPFLTNESVFGLTALPARLLVLGAGPIGSELAQAFRRLGSAVTLVDIGPILPKDDPELRAVVKASLTADGVVIRDRVEVLRVEPGPTVVVDAGAGEERLSGTHLLVATGRKPNVEGLELERAGIAWDRRGITVDRSLRTSNSKVYAIGDVAGGLQFTHVAGWHGTLVIRNALFRLPIDATPRAVPWVTFTDPELAAVGLSEADAARQGIAHDVVRWPYADNDRARAERATEGLVKLVVGKRGRVLGASIVGAHAGELIFPWVLAVQQRMKLSTLASAVAPYPTLSEISKRAAGSWFTPKLFSDRTRKLVAFLARFG